MNRKLGLQSELRIGVVLVTNAHRGLQMGMAEARHAATLLRKSVVFAEQRVEADPQLVTSAAQRLVEDHRVCAIVGGVDAPTCLALHRFAAVNDVLYFNPASSSDELRGLNCSRQTFHVEASDQMRGDALALEPSASRTQALCTTWDSSLVRYGADTLNARFHAQFGEDMSDRAWNEWFAIKALWETFARTGANSSAQLLAALEQSSTRFDGHKGRSLSFRTWDHQLRQPMYVRVQDSAGATSVSELPVTSAAGGGAAGLDLLGAKEEARLCQWGARP
ncbi:MAG: ABC transporter substrate-binding protein [Phycisphaerae bacterium]|nr:ABC transporter substrate-binding protein [Gemmatimonadaceae bacterium]